jgi:hypothetical protein
MGSVVPFISLREFEFTTHLTRGPRFTLATAFNKAFPLHDGRKGEAPLASQTRFAIGDPSCRDLRMENLRETTRANPHLEIHLSRIVERNRCFHLNCTLFPLNRTLSTIVIYGNYWILSHEKRINNVCYLGTPKKFSFLFEPLFPRVTSLQ